MVKLTPQDRAVIALLAVFQNSKITSSLNNEQRVDRRSGEFKTNQ